MKTNAHRLEKKSFNRVKPHIIVLIKCIENFDYPLNHHHLGTNFNGRSLRIQYSTGESSDIQRKIVPDLH